MRNIFFSVIGVVLFAPTSCLFGMDFAEEEIRGQQAPLNLKDVKGIQSLKFEAALQVPDSKMVQILEMQKFTEIAKKSKDDYKGALKDALCYSDLELVKQLMQEKRFDKLWKDDKSKKELLVGCANIEIFNELKKLDKDPGATFSLLEQFLDDFFIWDAHNCHIAAELFDEKLKQFVSTGQKRSAYSSRGMNALECAVFIGSEKHVLEFLFDYPNHDVACKKIDERYLDGAYSPQGISLFEIMHRKAFCNIAVALYQNMLKKCPMSDQSKNMQDAHGRTLLFYAVLGGLYDDVQQLIDMGLDVSAQDTHGRTPLFYCLSPNVAELLVKHGANVCHLDRNGRTALFTCASIEMADFFLTKKVDINHSDLNDKAIYVCTNLDVVYYLISKGADITSCRNTRFTFLYRALCYLTLHSENPRLAGKIYQIIMLIIDKMSDKISEHEMGAILQHYYSSYYYSGNHDLPNMLGSILFKFIDKGLPTGLSDYYKMSALTLILSQNPEQRIEEVSGAVSSMIQKNGLKLNLVDGEGYTLLRRLERDYSMRSTELIALLKSNGAKRYTPKSIITWLWNRKSLIAMSCMGLLGVGVVKKQSGIGFWGAAIFALIGWRLSLKLRSDL